MSNNKTQISPKPKPSLSNKAWAYISIAGALIAVIYAGLSLQDQGEYTIPNSDSSLSAPVSEEDSTATKDDEYLINNQQDPSH